MEPTQPTHLIISTELAQEILNYIVSQPTTQPVGNVIQLVNRLQQLKPLETETIKK